jgi:hypothetical protein
MLVAIKGYKNMMDQIYKKQADNKKKAGNVDFDSEYASVLSPDDAEMYSDMASQKQIPNF